MKKYTLIIASFIVLASIVIGIQTVKANPIFFPVTTQTAVATSTISYMTAGTGTTTLVVDSYTSGVPTAVLKGTLFVQLGASSTVTTLRINQEYSQVSSTGVVCTATPTACDWYQDGGTFVDDYATTTKPFDLTVSQWNLAFSSSTPGLGAVSSTTATTTRAISVRVPTRYTRFIFTLPVGSAGANVWAQFIPQKETGSI